MNIQLTIKKYQWHIGRHLRSFKNSSMVKTPFLQWSQKLSIRVWRFLCVRKWGFSQTCRRCENQINCVGGDLVTYHQRGIPLPAACSVDSPVIYQYFYCGIFAVLGNQTQSSDHTKQATFYHSATLVFFFTFHGETKSHQVTKGLRFEFAILLPQGPRVLEIQSCTTTPGCRTLLIAVKVLLKLKCYWKFLHWNTAETLSN